MKKFFCIIRKFWLLIFLGIILCLLFGFYRPFEPHYQWKPLSVWATRVYSSPERDAAVEAIRHIGTNALPYAIKFCCTKDSAPKIKILEWIEQHRSREYLEKNLGNFSYDGFRVLGIRIPIAWGTQEKGIAIFEALGPMAKPAIPELIKLFTDKNRHVANAAADSLMNIGSDAIPPLVDALTNQDEAVRNWAAFSLEHMRDTTGNLKTAIRPAIPALIDMLNDGNISMRRRAADTLAKIQQDAPAVVPALIEALKRETNYQSSDFMSDSWGFMRAIGSFHTNAQIAAPVLIEIIKNDPSGRARQNR